MAVDQCYLFPVAKVVAKINERQRNAEPHGAQREEGSEGHLKNINQHSHVDFEVTIMRVDFARRHLRLLKTSFPTRRS